jgi:hypothetical protein
MSFDLKVCKKCGVAKPLEAFGKYRNGKGELLRKATCRDCYKPNRQKHYIKNKISILEEKKTYYQTNKEIIIENVKAHYRDNKESKQEYNKSYYQDNKSDIQAQNNLHRKEKRKTDPTYKLRVDFSTIIRRALKNNGGSKKNTSLSKYLPYSIKELRKYLELQFESWMTWENHGKYNKETWDNDNQMTWTWQIDHIIPQSDLPYSSMEDDNFKKCWALENLRPLSAKQNWLDGINRTRHGGNDVV